ncbi:RNA polymerase sigma factor [Streptomyces sp. NPDC058471]|uniref:RNA polymerase sigma factor n=1 Tax=Streptomyces sp. NPDC058471 TaxID=3346516 RepID=UPI003649AA32
MTGWPHEAVVSVAQESCPDAGLHQRLVYGDETALAEVYDTYAALVHRVAGRVTRSPSAAEDVAQEVFAHLRSLLLHSALARLPLPQRQVVHLAYFAGRTYRQAAVELGIPEGTAKTRLRAALRRLAEALAEPPDPTDPSGPTGPPGSTGPTGTALADAPGERGA